MINSTDLSRFCMGSSLLQIPNQLKFFAIIKSNSDHNQTGFLLLKCLILLPCYYNEFVKFPFSAVFKNITLCARFTLRTLAGRLILRRHLKTTKAVFTIPNSFKCLILKETTAILQAVVCKR